MEDDDQKARVRLVGRNGRRRYDPASKDCLVAACLEPGVSVSKLALEHGVNANLRRKWIKKRTETQSLPPPSSPAFIPVRIESTSDRLMVTFPPMNLSSQGLRRNRGISGYRYRNPSVFDR